MLPSEIPEHHRKAALKQWAGILNVYGGECVKGLFMYPLVALTSRSTQHPIDGHPILGYHKDHYKNLGSSGFWEYENTPYKALRPYSNYEDGSLGEPSGKHSARWNGKERSFLARCAFLYRNPVNWLKRTDPRFHCLIDECDVYWWSDKTNGMQSLPRDGEFPSQIFTENLPRILSDKTNNPETKGWYFVLAVHRETGDFYYGYRSVTLLDDNHVRQVKLGFKIKPEHAGQVQDADDKDKAFTFGFQPKSKID